MIEVRRVCDMPEGSERFIDRAFERLGRLAFPEQHFLELPGRRLSAFSDSVTTIYERRHELKVETTLDGDVDLLREAVFVQEVSALQVGDPFRPWGRNRLELL